VLRECHFRKSQPSAIIQVSVQPILGDLRASASAGILRRNPLYLIAFLIFFVYAANKLAANFVMNCVLTSVRIRL